MPVLLTACPKHLDGHLAQSRHSTHRCKIPCAGISAPMWRVRDEEGKRTQAGKSRKQQDCLAEVWALGSRGAPGCRGLRRYTVSRCSAPSHGWTTSSLLGGFLLSTKPTSLTSSGCFPQLEQGSKISPCRAVGSQWREAAGLHPSLHLPLLPLSPAESAPDIKRRWH